MTEGDTTETAPDAVARRRAAAYWLAGVGLVLAAAALRDAPWRGGAGLHTVMEAVATLLALLVGGIALVRYYSRKNNAILFVGTGFLGTAFLDGYHTLVTSEFMTDRLPSSLSALTPWSWAASRLFLSALLCLSVLAWARERRLGTDGQISERWVYGLAGALTLTCFAYFALAPLPRAYYPEIPLHRPEELLPALCFVAALVGYLRKGRWRTDAFEHWLVLSLVVGVVDQIALMSFSARLFDAAFHGAHLLKSVSYACVLTGLLISMYSAFQRAEADRRLIARTNARLRQAMLEREYVELELRDRAARFRDVAESMSDWIWEMDADLRFSYHSDRLREVTGIDPATLLGRTRRDMGRGDTDEEKWRRHLADLDARRPFRDFRYTFIADDGRKVHFSTSGKPVFDEAGRFLGYRGTGSDITAQVEAEERARSAQERLALAVEGLSELVVLFDADDRIVLSNQAWRDLNREVAEFSRPGVRFEDHLCAAVTAGLVPDAVGREEEWLSRRMALHRDPGEPFEVERQEGCWLLISEQRLPDGGTVLIITDISERKRAEAALRESEQRFRGAIETLQEGFALYDADDRLVLCNEEYRRLHPKTADILNPGMRFEDLVRANIARGTNADAVGREEEHVRERLEQHRNPKGSIVRHLTDDRWFIIKENRTPDGGIVVTETDISELKHAEKALRESEERFRAVVDNSPTKIHIKDLHGRYLLINRQSELLFGVTNEEAKGKTSREIFPPEVAKSFVGHDQRVIDTRTTIEEEEEWSCADGIHTYLTVKFPILGADGEVAAVGGIGTDITERKRNQAQIEQIALYDGLTGLPNRFLFNNSLRQGLAQAKRAGTMLALMFLDLDDFKGVNDTLGHDAGDVLLKAVAERLQSELRETDTLGRLNGSIARLGGDEFTVILTGLADPMDAVAVAERIIAAMRAPFTVAQNQVYSGVSIGIAVFPMHATDPEQLLKTADMALYRAKANGRHAYTFYSEDLQTEVVARRAFEEDLHKALAEGQLGLAYQPQVDVMTGRTRGLEALLRWNHPESGNISPDVFVPIAESTGQIVPIGKWVLTEACRQNKEWQDRGLPPVVVSVNISPVQFRQEDMVETVEEALRETGLDPASLCVEVTESLVMHDDVAAMGILHRLRRLGVKVALDDFGTGYSSLSRLTRISVDKIKLDRSFLHDVEYDTGGAAIIKALVTLGHSLGVRVSVEGAETLDQIAVLSSSGVDEIQGFYFSKVLKPEAVPEFLTGTATSFDRTVLSA